MTRKRKADVEEEERLVVRDVKRIRNPLVHKTHFRTIGESGIEEHTVISGRELDATEISVNTVPPEDAIPSEDDKKKKQTQVRSIHYPCYMPR